MDALYSYASQSKVTIADLQTQAGTGQKGLFTVTNARLTVQGSSRQLVDFVARIQESSQKGFVINNVNIGSTGASSMATLQLDISLYISPLSGVSIASAQVVTPTVGVTSTVAPKPAPKTPSASSTSPASTATAAPRTPTTVPPTATAIPPTATLARPTPIPTATLVPQPYFTYVVRPGDTLFSLARRYGTTISTLQLINRLPNYNIQIGQQLMIPTR